MINNKLKIIHITDSFCIGGRERLIADLCNNLDTEKYDISIISLTNESNDLLRLLNSNIKTYSLSIKTSKEIYKSIKIFYSIFKVVPKLRILLNEIQPDLIHSHSSVIPLFLTSLSIKLSKVCPKFIITIHSFAEYYQYGNLSSKFFVFIELLSIKLTKANIISISKPLFENNERFRKSYGSNILIENGIDLTKYSYNRYFEISKQALGFKENDILVTYVARMDDDHKNHKTLMSAFQLLAPKYPFLRLLLVGDGTYKTELEKHAKFLNIDEKVIFTGFVNNVPELLKISDVGVFPSKTEGFSLALLEMMSMKIPMIVSNIPAFYIIEDEVSGLIFPKDSEYALSKKMETLILNKELREKLSENGYRTALNYSLEKMVDKYESKYDELLLDLKY